LTPADAKRRLLWHGMLIFGLGLLTGAVVPVMTNPRMGVAAHLGGVMSGMLLLLVGVIWGEIRLPASAEKAAFWLFLYASYTGWLAQLLAASFGTRRATPISGTGYGGGRLAGESGLFCSDLLFNCHSACVYPGVMGSKKKVLVSLFAAGASSALLLVRFDTEGSM